MHTLAPPGDPVAAVTHPDPYPYYAALAQHAGLVHEPRLGLWIAAHPDLVRAVLAHPGCRVRPAHEPVPQRIAGPAGSVFAALVRMNDDGRQAIHKAALAHALTALPEDEVARCAHEVAVLLLADRVDDAQQLNRFVSALPVCTMARLLGFDAARLPALAAWTEQFVACLSPLSNEGQIAAAQSAAQSLLAALRALVAGNVQGTGLLADIRGGQWADDAALLSNLLGLLSQTFEATAGLLGNCIAGLLRGADPARPVALVARTLRSDPAIHNTRRYAAAGLRIGGMEVRTGDAILLVLATREAQHGFGHGRHACPGQALARTVVAQGLQTLLETQALPPVAWRYRPSANARLPTFMEISR